MKENTRITFLCKKDFQINQDGLLINFTGLLALRHGVIYKKLSFPFHASVVRNELTVKGAEGNAVTVGLENTVYNSPTHALKSMNDCVNFILQGSGGEGESDGTLETIAVDDNEENFVFTDSLGEDVLLPIASLVAQISPKIAFVETIESAIVDMTNEQTVVNVPSGLSVATLSNTKVAWYNIYRNGIKLYEGASGSQDFQVAAGEGAITLNSAAVVVGAGARDRIEFELFLLPHYFDGLAS